AERAVAAVLRLDGQAVAAVPGQVPQIERPIADDTFDAVVAGEEDLDRTGRQRQGQDANGDLRPLIDSRRSDRLDRIRRGDARLARRDDVAADDPIVDLQVVDVAVEARSGTRIGRPTDCQVRGV